MTLTEFLLTRYSEDEAGARYAWPERSLPHLLADIEAKRRIVEDYAHLLEASRGPMSRAAMRAHAEFVVRVLATPYTDHPDYREEWKP